MKKIRSEALKKSKRAILVILLTVAFIFSGCGLVSRSGKQEKEEKSIFGDVEKYNPRIKEIEKVLKAAGFNPGAIDGIIDKQTRKAIRDFQRNNKLKQTGYIDINTQARLDAIRLEILKKIQGQQGRSIKNLLKSPEEVKKIQRALKKAGFEPGAIDGTIGEDTRKAIIAFQKSKGLPPDGMIGPKTWEELSKYF